MKVYENPAPNILFLADANQKFYFQSPYNLLGHIALRSNLQKRWNDPPSQCCEQIAVFDMCHATCDGLLP